MSPAAERDDPARAHRRHFQRFLWVHYGVILVGAGLLVSPPTFGYGGTPLAWSDHVSGLLLILFGSLSLAPDRLWAPWAAFAVGAWLQLAPLVFWAPEAAAYLSNTVAGIAVISLTVLVPGLPGEARFRKPGPEVPPGWSHNPSSWPQRMPLVVLAVGGWFMSRHLAAFHLGYIDWAWDPLFGDGTVEVLTSDVSEAFPVSDAGLGAAAYTFEALLAFMGLKDRWRTNPSTVLVFGLLVVPLGVTHLVLVTLMPVLVGAWCTFCLLTAILMLVMVPLAIGEIVATFQFIQAKREEGLSFWTVIARGGTVPGGGEDTRTPLPNAGWRELLSAMTWGVSVPWNLLASTFVGVWLMVAPPVLGIEGWAANSSFLTGALVITVSVVALGEVVRAGRFLNVPLALWIAAAAWVLPGASPGPALHYTALGLLLVGLSLPRGPVREHYGSWDRRIV